MQTQAKSDTTKAEAAFLVVQAKVEQAKWKEIETFQYQHRNNKKTRTKQKQQSQSHGHKNEEEDEVNAIPLPYLDIVSIADYDHGA